jgi:hypothetical protein
MAYSFFWGASLLGTQTLDLIDDEEEDPLTDIVVPWEGSQTFESFTIEPGGQYQLVLFNSNREYDTSGDAAAANVAATAAANAAAAEFENGLSGRAASLLVAAVAVRRGLRRGHAQR